MKRIRTHRARSALAVLGVVAIGLLATGAGGSLAAEKKAGGTLTIGWRRTRTRSIRRWHGPSSVGWSSCTCARSSTT